MRNLKSGDHEYDLGCRHYYSHLRDRNSLLLKEEMRTQNARTDRLYEMFIDLLKEKK